MADYKRLQALCDDVARHLEFCDHDQYGGKPERELRHAEKAAAELLRGIIVAQVEKGSD